MSELREKMCSGQMYNDLSIELCEARQRANKLTRTYNLTSESDKEIRKKILDELLEKHGKNTVIEPNFRCEFGFNITVGDNFFSNFDCIILDCAKVTIGNNVLFGPRVGIYLANHAIDVIERRAGGCIAKPVNIGNDVWVGAGVNILGGVTIGDSSIIGAGSVVTKDVPPNVIAVGNPCRVLRSITDGEKTTYINE